MVKVAERMRELRNQRNMTQKNLADELGITVRTYQYYEADDHRPDIETLIKLADFYDVTIDYLVGRTDERA